MAEKTKSLCAMVPESLHAQVRQRQEAAGQTLSEYITQLITNYFAKEGKEMAKGDQRTVAFQVDAELFEQFKAYLKTNGIKQNVFFINAIRQVLESQGKEEG